MRQLGKKILDSKALYVILSILISISMWFYVISMDENQQSKPLRNIPITFVGAEQLESRGLMIAGDIPTGSVTVRGTPSVLAKLTDDTVSLQVDLTKSSIEKAAEYTMAYTVKLPIGISPSQVQFVSGESGNVTFTVSEYREREIELRGKFVGTTAEGYLAGDQEDFVFTPRKLTISGQAELVNQVAYAEVVVDGKNLTSTVRGQFPYQFVGASGDIIGNLDVERSADTVQTTFPILATAEIPLRVDFVDGGGLSKDDIKYTMSLDTLTVAGSKTAVEALTTEGSILLGTIDLGTVHDADQVVFDIALTDELSNVSGVTQVTVSIEFKKPLESKVLEVSNIHCIAQPEGWTARPLTKMLEVEVRGSKKLVDAVTAEDVRVVADLSDINQASGQYTVTANVYLDSVGTKNEIDVVGRDYKIVVSLYRG